MDETKFNYTTLPEPHDYLQGKCICMPILLYNSGLFYQLVHQYNSCYINRQVVEQSHLKLPAWILRYQS